jgi:hypothetical protein
VGSDAHAERGTGLGKHWGTLIFYGVVSAQTEKVVEFFLERDAAEAMIVEVRGDDPVASPTFCAWRKWSSANYSPRSPSLSVSLDVW